MSRRKRIILLVLAVPLMAVLLCGLTAAVQLSRLPIEDGAGHDGSSKETAILILAENEMDGVNYEYLWLALHHPADVSTMQSLVQEGERVYDVLELEAPDGGTETIYFDITAFFGQW